MQQNNDSELAAQSTETAPTDEQQSLIAYPLPGADASVAKLLRQARPSREWMDKSAAKYAYRCIPLTAANTMGWEYINPVTCEFSWGGFTPDADIKVWVEQGHRWRPRSHFGTGVVTWELPFLFRTPPGYGLVVAGPANHDKNGIAPLDGFIRTDWLPYPFTMNWRITEPNKTIRFEQGEPIARIFPYPLGLLEDFQIEVRDIAENPDFLDEFRAWAQRRKQNYQQREQVQQSVDMDKRSDTDALWSRAYAKGEGADEQHQTVFKPGKIVNCLDKK